MSRIDNIINSVNKNGIQKKKSRVDSIIESTSKGNINTGVDEEYVNSFFKDFNDYSTSINNDYKNVGYNNASSLYEDSTKKINELGTRARTIKAYLNANKSNLDEDTYNKLTSTIDEMDSSLDSVFHQLRKTSEYYSQWKSEDEYKKANAEAIKAQEDYEAMLNFDLGAGQKEIESLEAELEEIYRMERLPQEIADLEAYMGTDENSRKYKQSLPLYNLKKMEYKKLQLKYPSNYKTGKQNTDVWKEKISSKKAYLNQAKRLQKSVKLTNDAINAEDFEEYSKIGMAVPYENIGTKSNNSGDRIKMASKIDNYRAAAVALYEFQGNKTPDGYADNKTDIDKYRLMNKEEFSIFAYYLGYDKENGTKKANEYIDSIEQTLNTRVATKKFEKEYKDNTWTEIFASIPITLDNWFTSVKNSFNTEDDYIPQTSNQILSGMINEDLVDDTIPLWYNLKTGEWEDTIAGRSAAQIAYEGLSTITNMAPSIAVGSAVSLINPVAGSMVGTTLFGASAAGSAYQEALALGYDKEQARSYSTLVGTSEAMLQYFLGGIGSLGGKLSGKTISTFVNNMDNAFLRISAKLGVKGGSEFLEEYAQEILTPVFKNLTLDTNEDFKLFSADAMYSGMLGAFTAFFLEGGGTIRSDIKTTKLGKNVQKIDGGVAKLKKLGTTFSADSVAFQIADKVTEETGAYQIGRLLQEVGGTLSEQNVSDIIIALNKKGMDISAATKLARQYQAILNGEMSLTDEQVKVLENCDPLADVLRKNIIGRNTDIYQRTREYSDLVKLATEMDSKAKTSSAPQAETEAAPQPTALYSKEYIDTLAKGYEVAGMPTEQARIMAMANLSTPTEGKSSPTKEKAVESKFETSMDGKTTMVESGEEVNIKSIESISEGGEANLNIDDGMVVKASDISFGSETEALFVENIGKIKMGKKPIGTNTANALYQAAMTALKSNPNMTADEAMSLIKGLEESYIYGTYNLGRSKLTARDENGKAVLFAGELTQEQRKFAYELGTKDAVSKAEADQKVIDEAVGKTNSKTNSKTKNTRIGKVVFEGDARNIKGLTETQRANLEGIKLLAEVTNYEIHLFKSDENLEYTMPDGAVRSANGWYIPGTNQIWSDIKSGNFGEGTMLWTAAHEIAHDLRRKSPKQWKAMADLILKTFAKNNVDTEGMLSNQVAKIEGRYKDNKSAMPSNAVILDMAYEELVSDALTDMLTDGSIVQFMAEVKAKDRTLGQKILDAIKSLLEKWGLVIDSYKGRELETAEAQALSKFEDVFKQLQEMYRDALMEANEVNAVLNADKAVELAEAGIGFDETSGEVFAIRDSFATNDKITVGKKSFDINSVASLVAEVTGRSIEDARKWVSSEMTVANIVMRNPEFLDFEVDDRYEAIKKNSDYPQGTVDLSNLCPKRSEFTTMFDMLQKKYPNKLFTASDVAAMRSILADNGITVACGACFVEDRRQLLGEIADTYISMWKEAVETGKPLHKTNAEGRKIKLTVTSALAKQYGVTKGADILATDTYIPTQHDLTTYEGFRLLEKNHPTIAMGFNRYNNSRGQQSGRLIEGRAEYKRQILGWSDAKVKSVNNNGGLRIFSFSDFEVVHMLDLVQVIIDCAAKGVKIQGYTKIPAFAKLVRNTGIKLNRSFIPKGDTGIKVVNGKKVLDIDTTEGIDINDENFLDESDNPNVGNVIIGINPEQIGIAMLDDGIDYIIPFHSNKAKAILKALGLESWVNYKESQHEKDISTGKASKHNVNIYTQVINKYNPSNKVEFVEVFIKVCEKQGKIPRYAEFLNKEYNVDGAYSDEGGNFSYTYREGYHKFLVDFKMFDKEGNILPQEQITPTLDDAFMTELLNAEVGKKADYEFPQEVYDQIEEKFGGETMFSERKQKVNDAVDKAIKQKGDLGEKYNQVKISKFPADISKFVSSASEGRINLTGKYIAVNGDNIWHEFKRHSDASIEADRNQLPITADTIKEAVMAIYAPDVVESLFSTAENPTQRQSFAYAKKSPNGYYIVVEAVGGKKNPNVVPVMLLQFTEEKWNNMISSGKTLGELLFENDAEKRNSLDVELNKKNRVTVAQFASKEAIANTPRSPRFDDIIPQIDGYVNIFSERDSQGNELSKGQQEFFKDSKVRDENGNLLVLYHGTDNGGFTIFDPSKSDDKTSLFLTASKEMAQTYAISSKDIQPNETNNQSGIYSVYANITNPYVVDAKGANWNKIRTGLNPFAKSTRDIAQKAKKKGYDGVIIKNLVDAGGYSFMSGEKVAPDTVIIAFDSNQIKLVSNINPTTDPDIRYSERVSNKAHADTVSRAVKRFGTTTDFAEAGFILPNGEMLRFTDDKHKGERQFDHRAIGIAYGVDVDLGVNHGYNAESNKHLDDFVDKGGIRFYPGDLEFNHEAMMQLSKNTPITREQEQTIRDFIEWKKQQEEMHNPDDYEWSMYDGPLGLHIDFGSTSDVNVSADRSALGIDFLSYKGGQINADRIIADIRHYYRTGETRKTSSLAQFRFSERGTSNRSILANALEGAAQNDIEKNKLAQYKEKIALIEAEEKRLSEIQKQLFTKGGVEPENRKALQFEAKQIANRINTYDRQLLNLESTTALKNVLNREKVLAMKRQKQKDTEYLKQYKEKVAKDKKVLLERHQESRKKAIEGREKTTMRHKIKTVVNDLNNLLLKPTKERHVPEEMRLAVAESLAFLNMDTVDADTRVAKYNDLIAKANDPDIIASLTETRDRILTQGNKLADKLAKLKEAYALIGSSADDSMKSMYDDVIYSKIESVQKKVGTTPIRNMSLEQLESVYELYKMVLTTVRDSNKAFAENLKMTRDALGSNTFGEIKDSNLVRDRIKHEFIEKFGWQNLKPMQAMKTIGSGTLQKLWENILYGQEVFAVDYDEAVKFAKEMKDKYGYKKWDLDKLYSFDSKSGKVMKINLEQMMSIYAYSKRNQADEHIEYGGIVLNEGIIKEKKWYGKTVEYKVNDSTAYRLDKKQVGVIISTLEKVAPGAKEFVDEMQKYLSETMGEKGNEVSMKMYGIKLFKEEHYFPLKSSKEFMEAANTKLKGDVKIKNKGMTKSTVEHARNPIVLENFLDVWGNHINEMAMYHGLVLPLEDFSRTLNYSFKADEKANTDAESVKTALKDAFGDNAEEYLNNLLKAINGGVLHDSSAAIADKMLSKFKKAKVMASLSVVVQQPTAIIRAMGIIEPKYFVAQNFHHKATWEELKKYCPTAIIKETGSFDTNMGRTIVDMIKEDYTFTDKVGDVLGKAPAFMDEMGWNMIWRALKNKVATEQKLSGEALLQECGKQMTLIINETQVYDSVMSRNELMRSKSVFTKMATAFGAEPSTVANMVYGAALDFKRGNKKIASKTIAATIGSIVINGLVSSMVYALRDDDEEKTLLEKYLSSATTEVLDGLNPLTYIPFAKDFYSILQGYKVERTDMALIQDVVDAINDFYNVLDPEAYEDMSRDEIAKHIYDNSVPLLTSICDMFGLPVGNVLRDAEAIIINDNVPMSQTSSSGIGYAFKEGLLNALPKIVGKVVGTDSKQDKLYDAIVSGDTAYLKRLKSGYKDDKAYETAVRKALRENDSRIREAAEARVSGKTTEYARLVKEIKAEGFFSQDTIVASVNAEINDINKGKSSTKPSTKDKESSIYNMDDYYASIVGGDQATAYVVKEDIIKIDVANGKDRDKAESSFNSRFANYLKEQYEDGYITEREAERMLVNYGDKSEDEAYSKVQYWIFKQEYPDYDDLSEEAVTKYYEEVEPHGISIGVYYDYSRQRSKCEGRDANGDGKTDSGSVKAEILRVINSLPLTYSQKDALYYLNGWSAKTIYEAPWH